MSFHAPEDAASLLEQFVHDVANAPAEITHLLEEIAAKDQQIALFKDEISKRDSQLQKWVRLNGGHVLNPKEDAFSKTVSDCYDKSEILQAEKCGLSEKALIVLERQIKRMDVGLRSLATREEFPSDWNGPSMLSATGTGANTPISSAAVAAPSTSALQPVSGNAVTTGGAPNIANAAQLRLAQNSAAARGGSGTATPTAAPRSQRESSSEANKRRRLNANLGSLPTASSHLRQSSIGPGTPKPGTPGATSSTSRAGSAQPTRPAGTGATKKVPSTAATTTTNRKPAPPQGANNSRNNNKQRSRPSTNATKMPKDRRRALARTRDGTPNTNSTSPTSSRSNSPTPSSLQRHQADGSADPAAGSDDEDEGLEEDSTLYCFCQKVSFGDMVGCDNDDCKYQWFHWGCVGLKSEPEGEWLCPACRKNAPGK